MATSWILITPATLPLLWGLEILPGPSSPPLAHTQPSSHEEDEAEAENKQHGDTSSRDGPLGHSCSRPRFPCRQERHLEIIPTLTPLLSTQRGILPLTCRIQPLGSPLPLRTSAFCRRAWSKQYHLSSPHSSRKLQLSLESATSPSTVSM